MCVCVCVFCLLCVVFRPSVCSGRVCLFVVVVVFVDVTFIDS